MQKKIIALAVAGLVSGAAFAQTNVQIYGIVDMGYKFESSHATPGVENRKGLDSGVESGSRIGFRGTEDLGNGLKAIFVLENQLGPDVQSGAGFMDGTNRQSYVGLAGNFGTVAFGRQYSPQHLLKGRFDPFAHDTQGAATIIRAADNTRLDNLAAYISPTFGGFNVIAGYTIDAVGNEVANDGGNLRAWAINPNYSNGPLQVGFNYHHISNDAGGAGDKTSVWDLGAGYNLGIMRVSGIYGKRKVNDSTQNSTYWTLGLTAPVGTGTLKASYNSEKEKEATPDFKERQIAVGYFYPLSKRTNLHAVYAKRSQDYAAYKTAVTFGIRHRF